MMKSSCALVPFTAVVWPHKARFVWPGSVGDGKAVAEDLDAKKWLVRNGAWACPIRPKAASGHRGTGAECCVMKLPWPYYSTANANRLASLPHYL